MATKVPTVIDTTNTHPPGLDELVKKLSPQVNYCIDLFGADRCMIASNFPMDKPSLSYELLYDVYKAIVNDRPLAQQKQLFADNAARIYKIDHCHQGGSHIENPKFQ